VENADNFGDFIRSNIFWNNDGSAAARAEGNFLAALRRLFVWDRARLFEMKVLMLGRFSWRSRKWEGRGGNMKGTRLIKSCKAGRFEESFCNGFGVVFCEAIFEEKLVCQIDVRRKPTATGFILREQTLKNSRTAQGFTERTTTITIVGCVVDMKKKVAYAKIFSDWFEKAVLAEATELAIKRPGLRSKAEVFSN
jgi:hypothetical protein